MKFSAVLALAVFLVSDLQAAVPVVGKWGCQKPVADSSFAMHLVSTPSQMTFDASVPYGETSAQVVSGVCRSPAPGSPAKTKYTCNVLTSSDSGYVVNVIDRGSIRSLSVTAITGFSPTPPPVQRPDLIPCKRLR